MKCNYAHPSTIQAWVSRIHTWEAYAKTLTGMNLSGATIMVLEQHVVSGGSLTTTRNGANGTMIGAGITTVVFNQIVFYSLAPVPIVVA